jgi:nucleotide-binding universal stress UspA family protein
MKILIAVDGSAHALATVEGFVKRREWFRPPVEITLFYAHPELPYKSAAAEWAGKAAVEGYYAEDSDEALAGARAALDDHGIIYSTARRVGPAAHEIVSFAESNGFDLIVLGTHGHSALAELIMGSVAMKVLGDSKVPVLFIK